MNKHDVNVKKGKLINLQIGLIAVLSFSYFMYGVYTYTPTHKQEITNNKIDEENTTLIMGPVIEVPNTPEVKVAETKPKIKKPAPITEKVKVVPDNSIEEKTNTEAVEEQPKNQSVTKNNSSTETNTSTESKKTTHTSQKAIPFNPRTVDVMPLYPGCEKYKTKEAQNACFEDKVRKLIFRKFNKGIGEDAGITGKQKVLLYFEVNTNGEISNVKAHNQHDILINEAKRITKYLPTMTPAKSRNKNVKMSYTVPIVFKAQ